MLRQSEVNIHLAMIQLANQLRTYGGRCPVLAAYNAGSGRIDRWRAFPEFADHELFAERIPFTETRDYVKVVQNNGRSMRRCTDNNKTDNGRFTQRARRARRP